MTTMTRFVPLRSNFGEMAALQDRLNSIFSEFARPVAAEAQTDSTSAMGSFVPAVDVYEDAQALRLQLEVPGVKQEDLDIRLENQTLTVKGERKFEPGARQENFHRIERRFGSFVRTFTLPQTIDTENISAAYEAGVLTITLAKKAKAKPRQVKIDIVGSKGTPESQAAGEARSFETENFDTRPMEGQRS